nr:MAG TPA: hypothetical protein [Caudoviricetes sp.]
MSSAVFTRNLRFQHFSFEILSKIMRITRV